MRRLVGAFCLLALTAGGLPAQDELGAGTREWATPGERRGWFAPTTPSEMGDWLTSLAGDLETVSLDTLAWMDGDPAEPDSALPVLLVRLANPRPAARERVRVLVLAGQRGDDLSGPEVALQITRELAVGDIKDMLDDLDLAIVPAANPWGLLWWMPDEPSGVDQTRDHVLLSSPATRAIHEVARQWKPHLVVELREIGPSPYRVQAGLPRHPNVDPALARYGRFYLLPYVANELARNSATFREYVTVEPESDGIGAPLLGAEGLPDGAYLTPGHLGAERAINAFSLTGSLSVMIGAASPGGADGLADRVQLLYESLGYLLEVTIAQADGLLEWAQAEPSALSVRHEFASDPQQPRLVWLAWNERAQIVQQTTDRWRPLVRSRLALPLPEAWVIEPSGREWAALLVAHGFAVERLVGEQRLKVGSYRAGAVAGLPDGLADDLSLDSAANGSDLLVRGTRRFPGGSWLVRADQPYRRLLFTLIEPWSQDAPLGREEQPPAEDEEYSMYPVHRIDAGTSLDSLHTEPAGLVSDPDPVD